MEKENQATEEAFQEYTGVSPNNKEFQPDFQLLAQVKTAANDLSHTEHTHFALSALSLPHLSTITNPSTLKDALSRPDADEWKASIEEEGEALTKKGVFISIQLSEMPKGTRLLHGKLVFKQKVDANGQPQRKKTRGIAQEFRQVPGIDSHQTYSLIQVLKQCAML